MNDEDCMTMAQDEGKKVLALIVVLVLANELIMGKLMARERMSLESI